MKSEIYSVKIYLFCFSMLKVSNFYINSSQLQLKSTRKMAKHLPFRMISADFRIRIRIRTFLIDPDPDPRLNKVPGS